MNKLTECVRALKDVRRSMQNDADPCILAALDEAIAKLERCETEDGSQPSVAHAVMAALAGQVVDIGRAVKLCRSRKGWTLRELAKRTGIAMSHLSMIEHNQRDASMSAMQSLADAFGMPLNVLIFLAADPKELTGISDELKEKLSRAALELLSLPTTDNLF